MNRKRHHSPDVSHNQAKRSRYDRSRHIDRYSGHYPRHSSRQSSIINSESLSQATDLCNRSRSLQKPSRELEKYRTSNTRYDNKRIRPKYISSGKNRAPVSDTRQPYHRTSTCSRFIGQSSNETPTASSKLTVDEIVPTHSGALPYAGIASNIIDGDSLCDLAMSGSCLSYPSTRKYYKEGEQGLQVLSTVCIVLLL